MAKKNGVFIYEQDCTDFSTTGLVGDIQPIEAIFTEEKNGTSEIVMKLTYDQYNRWKAAKVGNYVKCAVPVRVPPVIEDDAYATSVDVMEEGGST